MAQLRKIQRRLSILAVHILLMNWDLEFGIWNSSFLELKLLIYIQYGNHGQKNQIHKRHERKRFLPPEPGYFIIINKIPLLRYAITELSKKNHDSKIQTFIYQNDLIRTC